MIALIAAITMQVIFPTPQWPELVQPTPYQTPTPAAGTIDIEIDQPAILNDLATVQAQVDAMPTAISVNADQAFFGGRPVLPGENAAEVWSLFKWLTSTAGYAVFGPFQPIMIHLLALVTVALASLLIYYGQIIITALFRFIWFVINLVLKVIPFFG